MSGSVDDYMRSPAYMLRLYPPLRRLVTALAELTDLAEPIGVHNPQVTQRRRGHGQGDGIVATNTTAYPAHAAPSRMYASRLNQALSWVGSLATDVERLVQPSGITHGGARGQVCEAEGCPSRGRRQSKHQPRCGWCSTPFNKEDE